MARSCLLIAALLLATAAAAHAAEQKKPLKPLSEGLTKCLIDEAMVNMTNWEPIREACNTDSAAQLTQEQRCEQCPCALVEAIIQTLEDAGYDVDLTKLKPEDVQASLTLCQGVLLPALTDNGVDIAAVLSLGGCEKQSSCLKLA